MKVPAQVIRALNKFEKAVDTYALIGSAHPDDREVIAENHRVFRARLEAAIAKAIVKATNDAKAKYHGPVYAIHTYEDYDDQTEETVKITVYSDGTLQEARSKSE